MDINAPNNGWVPRDWLISQDMRNFDYRHKQAYVLVFKDWRDYKGRSLLLYLLKDNIIDDEVKETINLILNESVNHAIDNEGNSLMHYAIKNPAVSLKIIETLLLYGVYPDFRDMNYRPPLSYASASQKACVENLLIQYTILNKLKKIHCDSPDEILCLHFCKDTVQRNMWTCYRDKCIEEIIQMKFDKITTYYTMYDFISKNCFKDRHSYFVVNAAIDIAFERLIEDKYPSWRNIIDLVITQHIQYNPLDKVPNLKVFTVKPVSINSYPNQIITLTTNIVYVLTKFLPRHDVINLIIAFYKCEKSKN